MADPALAPEAADPPTCVRLTFRYPFEKLTLYAESYIERKPTARSNHPVRLKADVQPGWASQTSLTTANAAMRSLAQESRAKATDDIAFLETLMDRIGVHMTYRQGPTDIETSAAKAWNLAEGVCQDYAHILLSLLRAAGVAAGYVAGYRLPRDFMLAERAIDLHAWVRLMTVDGRCVDADPTNGTIDDPLLVTASVGTDYAATRPFSFDDLQPIRRVTSMATVSLVEGT